jgi:DEAD/DEAH box helicase domain-containing protein
VNLACWECRNLEQFLQVSARGDARVVAVSLKSGLRSRPWDRRDVRVPGLYCANCTSSVDADIDALGLSDDRIVFVAPSEFRSDGLADELVSLRSDAAWSRLELKEEPARYADLTGGVHPAVVDALTRTGRLPLFVHQAQAIEAAMAGGHVVQATSAGSGKSLGFMVPVLDRLIRSSVSTAILVFPLRALANDQRAALERLNAGETRWVDSSSFDLVLDEDAPRIRVTRYDGTTPEHEKTLARHQTRLLVTTPDMLHASVLRMGARNYKDGTSWERLLKGLQFVVLDELHSYQGVFGSNVAQVMRRLRRVARHHGASPQFLGASATVANPVELAEKLTGLSPFQLVDDDGSPRRRRVLLICNPPERSQYAASAKAQAAKKEENEEAQTEGGRIAPQTVAIELIGSGALNSADHPPIRTIAFCRSRNAVFQLARRIQNNLKEARRADLAGAVASYAATFLADDRVEAEGKLRDGSTLAVVSTSALELGIDIPDLSLAVLLGYPGQIASFRQRIGRVGRAGEGLAVLIVGDDPLQQFLARDPETLDRLLTSPAETVVINPSAREIVRRYGLAPAQEELGGIAYEDEEFFGDVVKEWLEDCSGAPTKTRRGIPYWRVAEFDEAYESLRGGGASSIQVLLQDGRDFKPIGTVDEGTAPRDAFVPSIWSGADGAYRVEGFDHKKREVYCSGPIEVGYLTRGVTVDRVEIGDDHRPRRMIAGGAVGFSGLRITRQVFSYVEQHFSGIERKKTVERGWPQLEFTTDGLFLEIAPSWADGQPLEESIKGVEHLLLAAAPALIACDPYDVDASSTRTHLFVYDSFGGGIRLTEPTYDRLGELVRLAYEIVATCPCEAGCPSCVLLARRPDGNRELSKQGALAILRHLRDETDDGYQ